jgi:hypothetical protein
MAMPATLPPVPRAGQAFLSAAAAACLAALLLLGGPPAARGEVRGLTDGPITVAYPVGKERAARHILATAAPFLDGLGREMGVVPTFRATVIVIDRATGGETSGPGGLPDWYAGAAESRSGGDVAWVKLSSAIRSGPADIDRTLRHELTHLYLRRRVRGHRLPRWFEEGMALRQAGEFGLLHRVDLSVAAVRGDLPRLDDLEASFPEDESRARLAYAASFSFTGRVLAEKGTATLRGLLDRVAAGEDFDEAFEKVFGSTRRRAESDWRHGLVDRWRLLSFLAGGTTLWAAISLIALVAWGRKRRTARLLLERMDEDEPGREPRTDPDPEPTDPPTIH